MKGRGNPPRTTLDFLRRATDFLAGKGVPSARLDAEVLLGHVLRLSRLDLYLQFDRPLAAAEVEAYRAILLRRATRCPVAYLVGEKEFFSLSFRVSPAVLVPRPETEGLVAAGIHFAREGNARLAADVGTGSGCLAVALAVHLPELRVVATDLSEEALAVTRENAVRHGVGARALLLRTDGLVGVGEGPNLDFVVSNPPYVDPVDRERLPPEAREFEPAEALFAPAGDPLGPTRRIAEQARRRLRPGGALFVEVADGAAAEVERLLQRVGFEDIAFRADLARVPRIAAARTPSSAV